jgi:hypothetical protein
MGRKVLHMLPEGCPTAPMRPAPKAAFRVPSTSQKNYPQTQATPCCFYGNSTANPGTPPGASLLHSAWGVAAALPWGYTPGWVFYGAFMVKVQSYCSATVKLIGRLSFSGCCSNRGTSQSCGWSARSLGRSVSWCAHSP